MNHPASRRLIVLLLVLAFLPMTAHAATTTAQYWEDIGGSASGAGISASQLGVVPEHRNTSMVIDADGRPVVAYTDWADIVVRRWNGVEWEIIAQPGGGHLPQLVRDANGNIYLGWMQFVPETTSWEVYLLVRDRATGEWSEVGGSATGGGISGADGRANVNSFSLALGADGLPWVAYDTTPTAGTDFTTQPSGVAVTSQQIYVKRWSGATSGWTYVGTDRTGGGATGVPSFVFTNPDGSANFALHGALSPTLVVRGADTAALAFIYTSEFTTAHPAEYNGLNDDIYAITWNGSAWVPMGPAIPAAPAGAGLGGPGGISNDNGWSVENFINRLNRPYMILARDGTPVLGWGETSDLDGFRRMYVRRWTGSAWQGYGSASGELAMSAVAFDISLAPGVNGPIAAWAGGGGLDSSIFVLGWDARVNRWTEFGIGSGTGTGISGAEKRSHTPWITADAAGVPSATWIQAPDIETGGQTFVRAYDARSLADLQVTALAVPATTRTAGTIAVGNTVRNLGAQPSPGVPLTFYLSTGIARSDSDVLLGSRAVPAMGVNGTSAMTTMLTMPPAVEPGTYRVLAVVDESNAAGERNENNNVAVSSPMTITLFRPELTLTALSVPATGATGRPLAITNTVRNSGIAPATAFTVRFYLSSDDTLDAGDTLLGSRTIASLAASASSPAVTSLTIPANTSAPDTYRVIAVVDADNQQTELDETNNTTVSAPVAISLYRPDLVVTALTLPATGATGKPLAITNTVRNAGPAPATAFTVRFYLSNDAFLEPDGDALLGSRVITSLAAGASNTAVTTLTIPANTSAPGTYHVIAVADAFDQQVETDETNNTLVSPGTVAISLYRPDLSVSTLTMPATGATGRTLAITNAVKNSGPAPAGPFTVRLYLSADTILDGGDVLLGSRAVGGLGAGATSLAVTIVTIPVATPAPADYHVIAMVDALDQQVETDEANNVLASVSTVAISLYRADLTVTAVTMPAAGATGRPLAITNSVRNAGPAPAGAFSLRLYLSADETLDAGDAILGSRIVSSLAAGATSMAATTVTIPPTTTPGTYRIIAVADADAQQVELDESNNPFVSPATVAITLYRPELVLTALGTSPTGAAGRTMAITSSVRNAGPAPATAFAVRFYLSTDPTLDAGDVLLGSRTVTSLAAGATSMATTMVTIPANTSVPVAYHVLAVVDALGQQTELDEGNNLMATGAPMMITAYLPDLQITAVSAPAGASAGHSLAISNTVKNAGPAPAGAFTVRFYLSSDDTLDAGDVPLGARTVSSLGAGASSATVTTVTIPAGIVVPNPYRILAVADALGQQAELDESNNVASTR